MAYQSMSQEEFLKSIAIVLDCKKPGFSFVQKYADWLYEHRIDFNISHVITYWQLTNGNLFQPFFYYGGNIELIHMGIDFPGLISEDTIVDTDDAEFYKYKGKSFWQGSHIISFPVPGIRSEYYDLRGVVILISKEGSISLDYEQKSIIGILLKNTHPNDSAHHSVLDCFRVLTNKITTSEEIDACNPEYDQLFNSIIEAIDSLSGKSSGSDFGLRHYSQWELLNDEPKPARISKIFSHNAYSDIPHSKTHFDIDSSDSHYLNSISYAFNKTTWKDHDLRFLPISSALSSFKDISYFTDLGLSRKNGTILTFLEKEKDALCSIKGYISCYYIKDFPYTIFTSPSLIINITQQIFKTIIRVGSYLNLKLLYCFAINYNQDSNNRNEFFKNISNLLARWNGADKCLIYQSQQDGRIQNMLDQEDSGEDYNGVNSLDIPSHLAQDRKFVDFIQSIPLDQGQPDLYETCNLYFNRESDRIKSAMVLSSYLSSQFVKNILIFINKQTRPSGNGTLYNDTFSFYSSLQTSLCGVFLYHYNLLLQSLESKNYLLKKFRHEIPSCTDAIKDSIAQIKSSILDGKPLTSGNLLNILEMMDLNNSRVSVLASFFSSAGFEDSYFARNRSDTSFKAFMNSYIDIFRTEGKYRGVDVYFDCRDKDDSSLRDIVFNVSNFFLLSVTNVIINAIRYSAPGTCVNVIAYSDSIEVTDIGIPIKDSDKNKIFNEGYRGQNARQVNEKGMGYGLYLTRRVVEAHQGRIEVESSLEFNRNFYLKKAIFNYYQALDNDKKKAFVYADVDESEFSHINAILYDLKSADEIVLSKTFLNNKLDVINEWVEYCRNSNAIFIDYPELFFDTEIYKVKFKIILE